MSRVRWGPPDDLEDYGDFVFAFASRYKDDIDFYQVWNEPNIYPEWGNRPGRPGSVHPVAGGGFHEGSGRRIRMR